MADEAVWHDHIFPKGRPWDSDDESNRFDALELVSGEFAVYDPVAKELVERDLPSRKAAIVAAQRRAGKWTS